MHNKIQFEGYAKSYLNKYLERSKSKEDLNIEFYDYLLNQILNISARTLLVLFYTFKKEDLLKGNTSKERYIYFDNYSKTEEFHIIVGKMYPLLILRLDKIVANNIINYKKLKDRVERDKAELVHKFGFSTDGIEDCHVWSFRFP